MGSKRLDQPTHTGMMFRQGQSRGYTVKLTALKDHWATPQGTLFRMKDGCPRGQSTAAIWKLDIASVKEIAK